MKFTSRLRAVFLCLAVAVCLTLSLTPRPAGAQIAPPSLYWTQGWAADWQAQIAANTPLAQYLISGKPGTRVLDRGLFYALSARLTGQASYAQAVYSWYEGKGCFTPGAYRLPGNDNGTNDLTFFWQDYAACLDWCRPYWTRDQVAQYEDWLRWIANAYVFQASGIGRVREGDTDANLGYYTGLMDEALVAGDDDPFFAAIPGGTFSGAGGGGNPSGNLPVGGWDYQPSLGWRIGLRNYTYDALARLSAGGVISYGSEYDDNILGDLAQFDAGVCTARGSTCLPELDIERFALGFLYQFTPDVRTSMATADLWEWGDVTYIRTLYPQQTVSCAMRLAGLLTRIGSPYAPYLQQLAWDLYNSPEMYYGGQHPYATALALFQPSAPAADWAAAGLPNGFIAQGVGVLYYHPGWNADDSFFGAMVPRNTMADHRWFVDSDWQLWRHGEWVVTHPMGYLSGGDELLGTVNANGLVKQGVGAMREAAGFDAGESTDSYGYLCGTGGGSFKPAGAYKYPATYDHETTSEILYLPSPDNKSDVALVHVRADVEDPRNLPGWSLYTAKEQAWMESAPATKMLLQHCLSQPSLTATGAAWSTPGGQTVRFDNLTPGTIVNAVSESGLPGYGYAAASELHWQIQQMWDPAEGLKPRWMTFSDALVCADPGTVVTTEKVTSTPNVDAIEVSRSGLADWLWVTNATPSNIDGSKPYSFDYQAALHQARLAETGATVRWSSSQYSTRILLTGYDPARSWSVAIDGAAPSPLVVDQEGVGYVCVHKSRAHPLQHSLQVMAQ